MMFRKNINSGWGADDLLCQNMPTNPDPNLGQILVTGASGYIGGRLVPELLARGYKVRAMVRGNASAYENQWPKAEVIEADAFVIDQIEHTLSGIEIAYYLIHSLYLGPEEFEAADIKAAANFRLAAEKAGVKRIIYLGGLGDIRNPLSSHLRNRMEVAQELRNGKVPVTILRAAVIIGSGSASYEIIQHLVRKHPVIPVPRWAKNRCQPISIRDVLKYLVGVMEVPETEGKYFDIGGQDMLTYRKMLKVLANVLNKKTIVITCPSTGIGIYSYLASLLTPVPRPICHCLMEGLKNEVVCQDDSINDYLPIKTLSYRESIVKAMTREEQDKVYTRWSDAYPPAHELALKLHELKKKHTFSRHYSLVTKKVSASLFSSICMIGGKEGWFHGNWIWKLRGILDRLFLGVGTSRGRKRHSHLEINDVIDFWRIEDIRNDKRLLLRAEMKIPGRAWLEFKINEEIDRKRLSVIAYYDTDRLLGRLYWYVCLPFHHFIFKKLLIAIEKRS
jgi:uncharacterized protein YbjT (DUF2867 family)